MPVTMTERGLFLSAVAELTGVQSAAGAEVAALGCGDRRTVRPEPGGGRRGPFPGCRRPRPQLRGTVAPSTHAGAHGLQVGGVHGGAQRHGPRLGLLQVVLHLHDAELEVHTPALLHPALLVDLLQLLLQAGQGSLVWNGIKPAAGAASRQGRPFKRQGARSRVRGG